MSSIFPQMVAHQILDEIGSFYSNKSIFANKIESEERRLFSYEEILTCNKTIIPKAQSKLLPLKMHNEMGDFELKIMNFVTG
jgi:hypothetical protein